MKSEPDPIAATIRYHARQAASLAELAAKYVELGEHQQATLHGTAARWHEEEMRKLKRPEPVRSEDQVRASLADSYVRSTT